MVKRMYAGMVTIRLSREHSERVEALQRATRRM